MEDNDYKARERREKEIPPTDEFEKRLWELLRLPTAISTREAIVTVANESRIATETFIVKTYRQGDLGDLIFLRHISQGMATNIVIPAKVADVIARQRDQLTAKVRSRTAKRTMQERKNRGEIFGFQKKKEA